MRTTLVHRVRGVSVEVECPNAVQVSQCRSIGDRAESMKEKRGHTEVK